MKPGHFDQADKVFGLCLAGIEFHSGFLVREIDCCMNARKLVEVLLDARGTSRASHALDGQFDLLERKGIHKFSACLRGRYLLGE